MTPSQMRQARQILAWSRDRLGAISGTSAYTVRQYENAGLIVPPHPQAMISDSVAAIRGVLEEAGVEFTGRGVRGVRLRRVES